MSKISFSKRGNGYPVVLIHGFPLNSKIWSQFADQLAGDLKVFTPDLPGFGKSEALPGGFSVNDVATALIQWIELEKIDKPLVIGHSLGGYVALAMADLRPDLLAGFGLFHSTALADSDEKKENRNKVLEFVEKNGVLSFTSNFIPPLFANQQHPSISTVKEIATASTKEAVIGYTKAMRDRSDRTSVLKEFHKPILIIAGEKDGGIPVDSLKKQASVSQQIELHILPDTAHMGMFEKPDTTLGLIKGFARKSNQP